MSTNKLSPRKLRNKRSLVDWSVNFEDNKPQVIKECGLEVQNYIAELERENLKLAKQVAELQVKYLTAQNMISALKHLKDPNGENRIKSTSENELLAELKRLNENKQP